MMEQSGRTDFTHQYIIQSVIKIVLIILLGSVMVYGLNTQISRSAYFTIVLLYFFFTKDNNLGISLLFILAMNPWGLFYYKPYNWIIQLTPTVGIIYKFSFPVIILLKLILTKSHHQGFLKDHLRPYYLP